MFDAGMRGGPQIVHDRVWTAANIVTFVRLLGLPVFVWLTVRGSLGLAFGLLAAIGATDWVDGYIARRFDQVTRIGQVLDPLIDRALLATAGLTLAAVGILPWWIIALVVGRDVLLIGVGWLMFGTNPQIPVTRWGKAGTALLLIGVPGFLLGAMDWSGAGALGSVAWVSTTAGLVTYYIAGAIYARTAMQMLSRPDAALPPPNPDPGASE